MSGFLRAAGWAALCRNWEVFSHNGLASCWRQWGGLEVRSKLQRKQKLFHICFYSQMVIKDAKSCHGVFSFLLKWLISFRSLFIGCRHSVIWNLIKLNYALFQQTLKLCTGSSQWVELNLIVLLVYWLDLYWFIYYCIYLWRSVLLQVISHSSWHKLRIDTPIEEPGEAVLPLLSARNRSFKCHPKARILSKPHFATEMYKKHRKIIDLNLIMNT